jgi:hypothetical protein
MIFGRGFNSRQLHQTFGKGQLERVGPFFIFILLAITRKVSFLTMTYL